MTYPNNIDYFVAKIDKNASGWYVSGENFNVPSSPYTLFLDHVPKDSITTTILPSGGGTAWTEDLTGSPAAGEYYVDYDTGKLTFNSADITTALEAQYQTLGDDIMSEHVNTLQLAASGVQTELGLGCRGIFQNVSQRLDTFVSVGDTINAENVACTTPPGATFVNVQEHIDASGSAGVSDNNPHGVGWNDIYNADGDMVRSQNSITTGNLFVSTISASGNQIGINIDGPDADQFVYFYDTGSPVGQYLKWDDGDSRFEFSTDLYIDGNITASGIAVSFLGLTDTPVAYTDMSASGVRVNTSMTGLEFYDVSGASGGTSDHSALTNLEWSAAGHTIDANIVPTASGTQAVGTVAVAFDEGHFDNLHCNYVYGDASYLTNVPTPGGGYVHIQSSPSVAWTVNHNLGTDDVLVQVADDSSPPLMIIPTEIEYTNTNTVSVTFSEAKAGEARVVTASGSPGGGSGSTTFLGLSDTPAGYSSFAASGVRVNAGMTGLEFCDLSQTGGGTSVHSSLTNLEWTVAGHTINTDILPAASGAYDIGSKPLTFSDVFVEDLYADNTVETSEAGMFYWGDPSTDGTWRLTRQGDNLVVQRRESSSWVTKSTFTP